MLDKHTGVGVDAGFCNWDLLFLFLAAEDDDDDILALAFLFHRGVQMTLLVDGDEDCSWVILVFGGVLGVPIGVGDDGVPPTAPSSCWR
jgi:hypothetical protein